ncbi:HisF Imidazoleglycerol-phosphate synthase [Candidatus Nanopelagicaceae bacterium]
MTVFRIFSRLDVKNSHVVKGIQLDGLRKIGNPKILAGDYLSQGADEIVLVDVVASLYNRPGLNSLITEIASELRIPITALGGIRNMENARQVFECGADKVAINSAGIQNPQLFSKIADIYGSQSVVCSIEAKRLHNAVAWFCMTENGRNEAGVDTTNWIESLESIGVGEVIVTSVDQDGTNRGPDLDLCGRIRDLTDLPVIYSGGIRDHEDALAIAKIGLDGIAIASSLHYGRLNINELKKELIKEKIFIRILEEH